MMNFNNQLILGSMKAETKGELDQLSSECSDIGKKVDEKYDAIRSSCNPATATTSTVVLAIVYIVLIIFGCGIAEESTGALVIFTIAAIVCALATIIIRVSEITDSSKRAAKVGGLRVELNEVTNRLNTNMTAFKDAEKTVRDAGGTWSKPITRISPVSIDDARSIGGRLESIPTYLSSIDGPQRFFFNACCIAFTLFSVSCLISISGSAICSAIESAFGGYSSETTGMVWSVILGIIAVIGQLFVSMMFEISDDINGVSLFYTIAGPLFFALLVVVFAILVHLLMILIGLAAIAIALSCCCGG